MRRMIVILAMLAAGAAAAVDYVDINTQSVRPLPTWLAEKSMSNPQFSDLVPYGWRICQPVPAIAVGYERLTGVTWTQSGTNALYADPTFTDTLIADRLAAEAAAQAAWLEGYDSHTRPQRAPSFEIPDGTNIYTIAVDPGAPDVLVVERESTRLSNAQLAAAIASNKAVRVAHRAALVAIQADLDQVEAQVASTNWTDVILTNITTSAAVWTNTTQRTTMIAVKDALQAIKGNDNNLQIAVKNLKQAVEKIRKEIR